MKHASTVANYERRTFPFTEIRAKGGAAPSLAGYAAVFDTYSAVFNTGDDTGFRERIAKGAFSGALEKSDVRALWNHDPNFVLGRGKSGTLTVREDDKGLYMENTPPDTQWARDLMVTIERGDVDQMSFGFTIRRHEWGKVGGQWVRTLLEVEELYDVSPVTYPAYPDTTVAMRSLLAAKNTADGLEIDEYLALRRRRLRLQLQMP